MQEWGTHNLYGDDFRQLADKIIEEFGQADERAAAATESSPAPGRKRAAAAAELHPAAAKKVKAEHIIPIDKLPAGSVLMDCPLINQKAPNVTLQLKAGHKAYVINAGDEDAKLSAGLVLAAFGRGAYKHRSGAWVVRASGPKAGRSAGPGECPAQEAARVSGVLSHFGRLTFPRKPSRMVTAAKE